MRNKRSSFVINLIETPNGFSLIQGTQVLNKPAVVNVQKLPPPLPVPATIISNPTTTMITYPKQLKNVYKKVNLIFPKGNSNNYMNITEEAKSINQRQSYKFKEQKYNHQHQHQQHKIVEDQRQNQIQLNISKISKISDFIEWFDMQKVHQKQISQIKLWYAEQNPNEDFLAAPTSNQQNKQNKRFSKYIEIYKKHRNTIIHLYYKDHYQNGTYLTVSQVRKRIPYDAYWLMKIHIYLCNNFIINFNTVDYDHQIGCHEYLYKLNFQTGKYEMLKNQLNMLRENDLKIKRFPQTPQEQNQALKLITNKIRPYCDYCGIHCGIVWFHHFKQVDFKQISVIMKNVNSKNPPLSQKPYQMILCTRCYCDGNFPILLTHHDFKKMTVNDKLQPNKKRKLKKKKKDKKRKQKLQRMQQNEHQHERMQQKQEEYYEDQPQEKYEQEQKNQQEKNQEQKNNQNMLGSNQKEEEAIEQPKQEKEEMNVSKMIQNILNTLEKPKIRTLQESLRLVQLVQKYQEDWEKIKQELQNDGYFQNCTILQLINFFVSLPRRNVSKLRQQYEPEQFLMENYKSNKNSVSDLIAQRTLNRVINLQKKISINENGSQRLIQTQFQWKKNLDKLIRFEIQKISNRIDYLQSCQQTSKQLMKKIGKISQPNKQKN